MSKPANISAGSAHVPVTRSGPGPVTASPAQEQLWALLQKHPDRPLGNFPLALNIEGSLDPALLVLALNDVVQRHEILHTTFEVEEGRVRQVIAALLHVPVPVVDLRLLAPGVREAQAFRLAREDAARPFDTRRLPLVRAQLFLLEQNRHILVLTLHRAVFDHESAGILLRELAACYEARRTGSAPALPELPRQYPDYSRDASEPSSESAVAWWQERFAGEPPLLRLPSDRSRAGTRSGLARLEKIELPAALCCSVGILAHREGTNAFTILFSAFQVLLHRYTNLTRFVVGIGVSDRPLPGTENLIGPCTRLAPCQPDLSGNPPFRVLLDRMRRELLETYTHASRQTFDELPRGYRNPALSCAVQFTHERREAELVNWPGLRLQELELSTGACASELAFRFVESVGRWSVHAECDAESFSASALQQLLAHFVVLLQAAVSQPGARLAELPLLTSIERRRLLHDWNNVRVSYPRDMPVHELAAAQAAAEPDAVAIACAGERLTYRELDHRSNQLGRHLRAAGIRPGRIVGVCIERSAELLVAVLGVLKAGGAVCLLEAPLPQTSAEIEAARLDLVLTQAAYREPFASGSAPVLLLDAETADIRRADDSVLIPFAGADDLCWIAWTTGTGGKCRPVEFSHRALVSMLFARRALGRINTNDVLFSASPLPSVDVAAELLLPLIAGARLELAAASDLANASALAARLVASEATFVQGSPSLWNQLLAAGWTGGQALRLCSTGEPLSRELVTRLLPACRELWNAYGTTETAGACLAAAITDGPAEPIIGRPFGNAQVHLLDAGLQPVPVGLPGEIYVGGESLANGYRDDPAETVARFPADPFHRQPGARLFRTGDVGCRLPSGDIQFFGRCDQLIPGRSFWRPTAPARLTSASRHAKRSAHDRAPATSAPTLAQVSPSVPVLAPNGC